MPVFLHSTRARALHLPCVPCPRAANAWHLLSSAEVPLQTTWRLLNRAASSCRPWAATSGDCAWVVVQYWGDWELWVTTKDPHGRSHPCKPPSERVQFWQGCCRGRVCLSSALNLPLHRNIKPNSNISRLDRLRGGRGPSRFSMVKTTSALTFASTY